MVHQAGTAGTRSVGPGTEAGAPASFPLAAFSLAALGGRVEVDGLTPGETSELADAWSRCLPDGSEPTVVDRMERGSGDWTRFHEDLVHRATRAGIDSGRGELLMFHAAALACPATGATIVLAAASGTGKTTATRTLGKVFGYVTDETAAVRTDLSMAAFAKPLSVLPASGLRPKTQYSPDALGLLPAPADPRLAVVAVLHRDRTGETGSATAEVVPLLEALEGLAPQISSLAALDRGLVRLCETLDACGGLRRLRYAEAEQLVPLVDGLLAGAPDAREGAGGALSPAGSQWRALPPVDIRGGRPGESQGGPAEAGSCRRVEVDDAVAVGDDLVLLHGERLSVLSGIGPALWHAARDWCGPADLKGAVVREFGDHPEADVLLAEHLEALVQRGILAVAV
ncbi:hypothetical protein GCM10023081_08800 [Arthrobacter ginkgonis]|uniref:Coenzyme PQQ synthesis protein D (PqqD) n=1 Tax=Arthrobacter ginkgonis TaxID=1630594 RepID=A0ABP7C1L8_9MICC